MAFVALAIGGSAVLGSGTSIAGGMMQKSGAKKALQTQAAWALKAEDTLQQGRRDALAYLDPFRQYGLNAASSMEAALYSPEQRIQQLDDQRALLEEEVRRATTALPRWEDWRRLPRINDAFIAASKDAWAKLREARSRLAAFDQRATELRDRVQAPAPSIEASPWYQFQADLLGRTMDRHFAARGLTGSGFEAEEKRRGLLELGAGETERQFSRLKGLYDVGAQASAAGAGAITNTSQAIANTQTQASQAQAQSAMNIAGANADMLRGISNSVTGAVGTGLNYMQFQNLIHANRPTAIASGSGGTAFDRYAGNLNAYG